MLGSRTKLYPRSLPLGSSGGSKAALAVPLSGNYMICTEKRNKKPTQQGSTTKSWELLNSRGIRCLPLAPSGSLPPARSAHYCHSASVLAAVVFPNLCPSSQLEASCLLYGKSRWEMNASLWWAGGMHGQRERRFLASSFLSFPPPYPEPHKSIYAPRAARLFPMCKSEARA